MKSNKMNLLETERQACQFERMQPANAAHSSTLSNDVNGF